MLITDVFRLVFSFVNDVLNSFSSRELFLEGNKIERIEGLEALKHLQSLHLQQNRIVKIENLDRNVELKYLDVSNNNIIIIEGLSMLPSLETLLMKENLLSKPDSIRNVICIKKLRELDLSMNKINCNLDDILEILSQCKSLKILSLKGNPVVTSTKNYRKMVISKCTKLKRLDGLAIHEEERLRCNAWGKVVDAGGSFDEADEADQKELTKLRIKTSRVNAIRRAEQQGILKGKNHSEELDGSGESTRGIGGSLGSSVMRSIQKAFGIPLRGSDASSNVRFSSSRARGDPLLFDAEGKPVSPGSVDDNPLLEELERVRGIVESQANMIADLKAKLQMDNSLGMEDSEQETSYSLFENERKSQKMALDELVKDLNEIEQKPGVDDFDPFSIFPPAPPCPPPRRKTAL
jgi:hypothetical protein